MPTISTVIIGALVLGAVLLATARIKKNIKSGGCAGGCSGCSGCACSHSEQDRAKSV